MVLYALSKSEAKLLDATADVAGFKTNILMERAGMEFAKFLDIRLSQKNSLLFVCGSGDNGGDGFVAARQMVHKGYQVSVLVLSKSTKADAATSRKILEHMKVPVLEWKKGFSFIPYDIIIDCLLGYGQKDAPKDDFADVISAIMNSHKEIYACDVPSGMDVDTGELFTPHIKAIATCSFAAPKKGFIHALDACGEIYVVGIGIPSFVYEQIGLPDGEYLVEGCCKWPKEE
jgi:NAD(P)H-hydrate epimerase